MHYVPCPRPIDGRPCGRSMPFNHEYCGSCTRRLRMGLPPLRDRPLPEPVLDIKRAALVALAIILFLLLVR